MEAISETRMQTEIILPDERYQRKLFIVAALAYGIPALAILIPFVATMVARGISLTSATAKTFYLVFGITTLAFWVIVVALIPSYFRSISYELTRDGVIVRKGVFTKVVKTIPYRNITNMVESRDLIDRHLVNLGSIKIQTAGKSGETGYEACLNGLAEWERVHAKVAMMLKSVSSSLEGESVKVRDGSETEKLDAILGELRSIRQLLERKSKQS